MGAAVMVRPANLFALFAWVLAVAAVCIARRPRAPALAMMAVGLLAGAVLPMLPQYMNNVRHYGQHSALVAARLGHNQQIWGVAYLKYATALPPVPNPSIFYENPFAKGRPADDERPLAWYAQYPLAGALTLRYGLLPVPSRSPLLSSSWGSPCTRSCEHCWSCITASRNSGRAGVSMTFRRERSCRSPIG